MNIAVFMTINNCGNAKVNINPNLTRYLLIKNINSTILALVIIFKKMVIY